VSICCITYNQEKYVRKTIEGILMQKTQFQIEIIISDDASTDNTPQIIMEYEAKYPDIIRAIYRNENEYSKGNHLLIFNFNLAKGKYIATCEGDDYWSDENKLQRQFECLEKNSDSVMCVHTVRYISEEGNIREDYRPLNLKEGEINGDNLIRMIMLDKEHCPFQLSSYFFRYDYLNELVNETPKFISQAPVGDIPLMLFLATKGNFFYIKEEMSYYRRNSVSSWSCGQRLITNKIKHYEAYINAIKLYDIYTDYKYSKIIDHYIAENEFLCLKICNNYPKMKDIKYREFYKKMDIIKKIRVHICNKIPFVEKLYSKWKEKAFY
jgi:glycosyltransferase involved in cell wall biosynthesis